jgi:hypothetical protein
VLAAHPRPTKCAASSSLHNNARERSEPSLDHCVVGLLSALSQSCDTVLCCAMLCCVQFGEAGGAVDKRKVWVICRQHPGEPSLAAPSPALFVSPLLAPHPLWLSPLAPSLPHLSQRLVLPSHPACQRPPHMSAVWILQNTVGRASSC